MQKRWVLAPKVDRVDAEELQARLGIHPILIDLLIRRGITSFEASRSFFRPSLDQLHDPFLMKDMELAVARIEQAIDANEKILIYGDYDVDGTTAVALIFGFFRQFHSRMEYYLPDRYTEGYGLSLKGIDYAQANGFSLIITLDCGIKAHEQVKVAREKGINVIISDHHLPGETLPDALAVLDPKREDCAYPFKELSGCGVGFKLVQAFILRNDMDMEQAYQYLDLVAVSIASDIVPITGENRILTHFGLLRLNSNPCCGLQALIELSGNRSGNFTINDILFQLGPRINAAGRIDHARDAVRLLLSRSLPEAASFSDGIDEQNSLRKDFDLKITEEAILMAGDKNELNGRRSVVLYKKDWHRGVIGIVASRIVERYYRPTVILTQTDTHITGSARSIAGVDLYEALTSCADLLEQYGGHQYAAGLTMKGENLSAFTERFEAAIAAKVTEDMLAPEVLIDAEIDLNEIDARFFRVLKQFEPFGPQHEQPVFLTKNLMLFGPAQVVGDHHLRMQVLQPNSPVFACIGFGLGHFAAEINKGAAFDICYTLDENNWRQRRTLQLNIKDIHINNYLRDIEI